VKKKPPSTTVFGQPQKFGSSKLIVSSFKKQFPRGTPLPQVEKALFQFELGTLTLIHGSIHRQDGYTKISATCTACKKTRVLHVSSIWRGATTNCRCQGRRKYGGDARASMLGLRYDCIVQRCERDSHKQSKNYKGRGIKCLFKSREHFVKWALAKWLNTDFKGLEFDRIDNNGHYEPDNLRLVTPTENHENRPGALRVSWQEQLLPLSKWPSPYCRNVTQRLVSKGFTGEQIIERAKATVKNQHKSWKVIAERLKFFNY
jgi:hypothetical protein